MEKANGTETSSELATIPEQEQSALVSGENGGMTFGDLGEIRYATQEVEVIKKGLTKQQKAILISDSTRSLNSYRENGLIGNYGFDHDKKVGLLGKTIKYGFAGLVVSLISGGKIDAMEMAKTIAVVPAGMEVVKKVKDEVESRVAKDTHDSIILDRAILDPNENQRKQLEIMKGRRMVE